MAWNGLGVGLANVWRLAEAETRSISPENFTGERGRGGMATEGTGAAFAREVLRADRARLTIGQPPQVRQADPQTVPCHRPKLLGLNRTATRLDRPSSMRRNRSAVGGIVRSWVPCRPARARRPMQPRSSPSIGWVTIGDRSTRHSRRDPAGAATAIGPPAATCVCPPTAT